MNISPPNRGTLAFTSPLPEDFEARSYARNIGRLLGAVQELSLAKSLEDIQGIVSVVARELTGCDGATIVLNDNDGENCFYADEDAIAPLWKGKRFPQSMCISGWVMRNKAHVVIPDIYEDDRIPADAYRPTFVKSLVMVPIRTLSPVGAIGNYWATRHEATTQEVQLLQALADATSLAMENIRVRQEADEQMTDLSLLAQAKAAMERRSVTDELTGLYNRRGFFEFAEKAVQEETRVQVLFIDLDGLKTVNDSQGHAAGDALIRSAADVLRVVARIGDVVARLGGDEFCMLIRNPVYNEAVTRQRIQDAIFACNAGRSDAFPLSFSVGMAEGMVSSQTGIADLLATADRFMYDNKRVRRSTRR